MIPWTRQGEAYVGSLALTDGRRAKAVLVAPRGNPKGAAVVYAGEDGGLVKLILSDALDRLTPEQVMDILCTQERAFGTTGLPEPDVAVAP